MLTTQYHCDLLKNFVLMMYYVTLTSSTMRAFVVHTPVITKVTDCFTIDEQ